MKEKIIRYFAAFLVFMLVCTVVSRGIYAYQMPQVTTGRAEARVIAHKLEVKGTMEAISEKAVVTMEGIRVRDICVREGEDVKKDTILFYLDSSSLEIKIDEFDKQIAAKQENLKNIEIKKRKEQKEQTRSLFTVKERGKEDVDNVIRQQKKIVEKARRAYKDAKGELASYPAYEEYLSKARSESSEYQTLKLAAEKKDATQEDKEAYSIFVSTFEAGLQKEWSNGKAVLEKEVDSKKEDWEDAKAEKRTAVFLKKQEVKRELEDAGKNEPQEDSESRDQQESIQKLKEKREKYTQLLAEDGAVRSGQKGRVQKINISVGEKTLDGAAMVISDSSKGCSFHAVLTEEEKSYLKVGDRVTLSFQNGAVKRKGLPIETISSDGNGSYQVRIAVKDSRVIQGESGSLEFTTENEEQSCCVPLSCLHAERTEIYVLVLRETETFLGKEFRVTKRKVTVEDKNEEYAALKDDPLEPEEKVIVSSDREIAPGDTVRMLEEQDD